MEIEVLLENSHVRLDDHVIVSHADAGDRSQVSTVKGMCVLLVPVLLGVIMFSLFLVRRVDPALLYDQVCFISNYH